MNEVLEEIYRKHRKDLQYPEHFYNPKNKFAKNKAEMANRHQKKNLEHIYELQKKSVDLDQRRRLKRQNQQPRMMINQIHMSSEQENTIKKYKQDYVPLEKQTIFPPLNSHRTTSQNSSTQEHFQSSKNSYESVKHRKSKMKKLPRDPARLQANKKRLRKCFHAVIFLNRLQKLWRNKLKRIQTIFELSKNLLSSINKLINKHYSQVMKFELVNFSNILKAKIIRPQVDLTQKIVSNLLQISSKLKETNIRKDLLIFLSMVTLERSPLPVDFFTQYEILRLDFTNTRFQLKNLDEARIKMIVGIFMGIKLCSDYLFRRPWEIDILDITENAKDKIESVLWAYSSYINCAILSYFKKIPKRDKQFLLRMKEKGVKPIKNTKIDDEFFNGVCLNYRKEYHKINANLIDWIRRITHQVLKWQQENFKSQL